MRCLECNGEISKTLKYCEFCGSRIPEVPLMNVNDINREDYIEYLRKMRIEDQNRRLREQKWRNEQRLKDLSHNF